MAVSWWGRKGWLDCLEKGPAISAQTLRVGATRPEHVAIGTPLVVAFIHRDDDKQNRPAWRSRYHRPTMCKLILFDIDGTLLRPNGAGSLAMKRALIETYGTSGILEQIYIAGMTDRAIIHQALAEGGFSPDEIQARWAPFTYALARHMAVTVVERQVSLCPGVLDLLNTLATRDDVLLGLVTGNLENTAPIKLDAVGIAPKLFRVGGYGSDDADRNKLPAIAAQRAEALTGRRFRGRDIVVVGDTPADVDCGRAVGAWTVAVATGHPPTEALEAAKPDRLLSDLSDLDAALTAILAN
jgi:phosphoglycolate phosphatase